MCSKKFRVITLIGLADIKQASVASSVAPLEPCLAVGHVEVITEALTAQQ